MSYTVLLGTMRFALYCERCRIPSAQQWRPCDERRKSVAAGVSSAPSFTTIADSVSSLNGKLQHMRNVASLRRAFAEPGRGIVSPETDLTIACGGVLSMFASIQMMLTSGAMMMAPSPGNLGWLLKQNRRYAPLLDTALKLAPIPLAIGAVLALPVLLVFNGYLGQLHQPAIPASQAGDWVFLLLFGMLVSTTFIVIVVMPAVWTAGVRWHAPTLSEQRIKIACAATALATVSSVAASLWLGEEWVAAGLVGAAILGGLAGGVVATGGNPPYPRVAAACVGFALSACLVVVWMTSLYVLLAPMAAPFAVDWPVLTAVGVLVLLLFTLGASIAKPAAGIMVGVLIAGYWVTEQASPDGGTMIASALYTANLGGGRPARVPQSNIAGEICNLGVDTRPVLFFEAKGCSRAAAFRRIRALKGLDSLQRRRMIQQWNAAAVQARHAASPLRRWNAESGRHRGPNGTRSVVPPRL